jgi:hypothetical protein
MLLTIAGVLGAAAVFNAVYPALTRSSSAVISASAKVDDRLKSDIELIHAVGELDSGGDFQDTNSNAKFDFFVWVKNIGDTRIDAIIDSDLFLGTTGNFVRVPHESEVEASVYPRWSYTLENNATEWTPRVTVKVTVTYDSTQDSATYDVKFIIPNGITDQHFFSI